MDASHIVVNIQIHSCVVHKPLEQTLNQLNLLNG